MRTCLTTIAVVLAATACDPLWSLHLSQAPWPAPGRRCLDSALTASPHVEQILGLKRWGNTNRFTLKLRDENANWREPTLEIKGPQAADSAVTVSFAYYWMGSAQLQPRDEVAFARLGTEVIEDLRRACAPSAPADVECRYGGFLNERECRASWTTAP